MDSILSIYSILVARQLEPRAHKLTDLLLLMYVQTLRDVRCVYKVSLSFAPFNQVSRYFRRFFFFPCFQFLWFLLFIHCYSCNGMAYTIAYIWPITLVALLTRLVDEINAFIVPVTFSIAFNQVQFCSAHSLLYMLSSHSNVRSRCRTFAKL